MVTVNVLVRADVIKRGSVVLAKVALVLESYDHWLLHPRCRRDETKDEDEHGEWPHTLLD